MPATRKTFSFNLFALCLHIPTKHMGRWPRNRSDLFILSKQYRESSRQRSENTQTVSSKSLSKLVNIETEVGSETSAAVGAAGRGRGPLIVSSGTRQTRRAQTYDSSKIFILCIDVTPHVWFDIYTIFYKIIRKFFQRQPLNSFSFLRWRLSRINLYDCSVKCLNQHKLNLWKWKQRNIESC